MQLSETLRPLCVLIAQDMVAGLPDEVVNKYRCVPTLLACGLVIHKWRVLFYSLARSINKGCLSCFLCSGYVYFPFQDQGHVPLWFEPYLQKAQRDVKRCG